MSELGFVLQCGYVVEAGRPVVRAWGRLENGATFLVRDDRQAPCFFVAADDAERARRQGAARVVATDWKALDGRALARVELALPRDAPALRERLQAHGIACYEADVRFAARFLIDRGIKSALAIEGAWQPGARVGRVYSNPVLAPADWSPALSALSLDVESDRQDRVLSVAVHGCGASEVLLLAEPGERLPSGAMGFAGEKELLAAFAGRVRELDPDVLTGWNVVDFDLRLLERRARACGATLDLGRAPGPLRLRPLRGESGGLEALVEGRVVLDGIRLLRASFVRMEEYSLDFVAREVLGEGKTLAGPERWAEILDAFRNDRERFVEYNRRDARLALEILERLGLLPLAVERSRLTGVTLERVGGAIASFDSLYLAELHRRRLAAPSVGAAPLESGWASPGGHVLEPRPGLHHNVLVFDFRSLYPSLIRTFQIDPAGFLPDPRPQDDPILAPNGAAFRRGPGILPAILDELVPRREAALRAGDKIRAHAIKILMNSCYGVLGTPACRFFRPELAGAITGFGRDVLLWSKAWLEGRGYGVLYGDTDSLFVLAGTGDEGEALERGRCLAAELNRDLAAHVRGTWRVESRLELQLDRLYARLHLPPMRHGAGGARKRYVGLTGGGGEARVVFTGLEAVRRDWTEAARRVQRGLYERLFRDEEVAGYLRGVVAELRAGRLDELLVYRKALRKPLAAYTATTPPHVAAARKLGGPARGLVAYLMTLAGPEPAAARRSPIDYEHYVQKQLRAVAEPVLELLGLEFDSVVGDATQLRLF